MSDYYVILTGSKNNAGDFLIKYRAKALFSTWRPDRQIVDLDAWKPFDESQLRLVNGARALILTGGPGLQSQMYPKVYPLHPQLEKIKVPVTGLGLGWKSMRGSWADTYDYPLTSDSLRLLKKMESSGLAISVRDFQTLNVLNFIGIENVTMTGCPAYYDLDCRVEEITRPTVQRIAFSLGVAFVRSRGMERLMKEQILRTRQEFPEAKLIAVFHHSLDPLVFRSTHGVYEKHNWLHNKFASWLASEGIDYVDISGSAEKLMDFYGSVDLHVGYRVHAHIFSVSIGKQSLLISEDGRAKGVQSAVGGMIIDGYTDYRGNLLAKTLNRISSWFDPYRPNNFSTEEIFHQLRYEEASGGQRLQTLRRALGVNYQRMTAFLTQLP